MSIAEKYTVCADTGVVNPVYMTMTLTASLDEEKGGETRVRICDEEFFFLTFHAAYCLALWCYSIFTQRRKTNERIFLRGEDFDSCWRDENVRLLCLPLE